jgi:hypothetical protein
MFIRISIIHQRLEVWQDAECVVDYPVSTALNGPGEQKNSGCTPRGKHLVRAKIGAGKPLNTVFVGRRDTGETYSADLARRYPQRDWILTRILWLSGRGTGKTQGK